MNRSVVVLGYMDWLLKAACVGFTLYFAFNVLNAIQQTPAQLQQSATQPSHEAVQQPVIQQQAVQQPVEQLQPQVTTTPTSLSSTAEEIKNWDLGTQVQWQVFCRQTNNGAGYNPNQQEICRGLQELKQ